MSEDNTAADWDLIMCIQACHQVYFGDRITDSGYPRSRIDNFELWTFLGIGDWRSDNLAVVALNLVTSAI